MAEKEEAGKAEKRGRLCIPKTMRRRILHEAHDTPAGGHFGADQTYLRMKDRYFWMQMWRDTQCYVAGCDLCHQTNHLSRKPMGLLQPLPVAKGRWQRIGIELRTDLPVSGGGHHCIVTFVDHMTKRAHWRACRKTIDVAALRAYSSTTLPVYTECLKRLYWTVMYASQQTIGEWLLGFCRRNCSCLQRSIQRRMVSLRTRTRRLYAICVASQLTIKPIGTTTSQ